ncbi:MAG: hypothetical protein PHC66_05165 [Candidatus Nanoarchaeia archaeon]|nr:hypothetical protein [Candidatus Nanoarchaeia archaeon]MDD5239076.1 hypothetical protein [Candidatus Nanoarchaeia archaeon]
MKNDECTIYLIIKKSGWKQKYKKVKGQWTQTTNGTVRKMTAEQFLSHLLPALEAGKASKVIIKVQKNHKKHQKSH